MKHAILDILKSNARETPEDIAKMVGATPEQVITAIKELQADGIICGWQVVVNEDSLDQSTVTAVIEVRITPERDGGFNRIAARVARFDEVEEAHLMSGGYDLLLFVRAKSLLDISRFVSEKLSTIDGILSTSTHFQLKTYKRNGILMEQPSQDERLVVSP